MKQAIQIFIYGIIYENLELAVSSSLTDLQSAKKSDTCQKVDTSKWLDFHLYDIFEIDTGTKLDKAKWIRLTLKLIL